MARSDLGEPRLLSPRTEVEWAGFCAPAHRLQARGWEFAVERDVFSDSISVMMRHGPTRAAAIGSVSCHELMHHSVRWHERSMMPELPLVRMREMKHDGRLMVMRHASLNLKRESWQRVDMVPDYTNDAAVVSAAVLGIFRPWTSEIIVPQSKTIDDLLAEIGRLQQPELADVRARARQREWSAGQAQTRVSQIVQLAA